MRKINVLTGLVALLLYGLTNSLPARANQVYEFTGDCTDTGCGTPVGLLTLTDSYVVGDDIAPYFVSFSYTSNLESFVDDTAGDVFSGSLVDEPPLEVSTAFILLDNAAGLRFAATGGDNTCTVSALLTNPTPLDNISDCSVTLQTTQTANAPEPATLALFGSALVGLAVTRRRHWTPGSV